MNVAILALLVGLLASMPAGAVRLRVATDISLAPYSHVENDAAAGIDVDLLYAAAERAGMVVDIDPLPWKRVLADIESGRHDLAMPLFRTPEREAFAEFIAPVHHSTLGLFVRRGKEFPFAGLADLSGKRIGVNRGFVIEDAFDRAAQGHAFLLEEADTTERNVAKLLAGRIDAFAANAVNARLYLLGLPDPGAVTELPRPIGDARPAFLVASRKADIPARTDTIAALRRALDDVAAEGLPQRLTDRYLKRSP